VPEPATARLFDGVIAVDEGADEVVGGMRLVERAAFTLARSGARRLLLVGNQPSGALRLPDVGIAWNDGPAWLRGATSTIVVTAATTITDADTVARLAAADSAGSIAAPRPAVLWRADPSDLAPQMETGDLAPPAGVPSWSLPPSALLVHANDARSRADAEHALYARLGRSGDGWFTRLVDRRFSRALTRILLPTGISPNQVTIASIAIGVAGGCCFARGTPTAATIGALLFLFSTIVDGCDGEIARLTFRESPFGARLDILGDNLVHLFLFGGIAMGLYRRSAETMIATLGFLLVGGVLLSMATVYLCIIRRRPNAAQRALFEAFASREFAYLLVVLTVVGRLDWFLWMSAVGTYAFATGLWVLGRRTAG
jgi:phosphatidylglycerophosphate synthase